MGKKPAVLFISFIFLCFSFVIEANEPPLLVTPKGILDIESEPIDTSAVESMVGDVDAQSAEIIQTIHFSGGTSLDLNLLAQDVEFLIGQPYSTDLVQIAISRVSERFHASGFPLAFATVGQHGFSDGKLTITVVEGYIIRSEVVVDDEVVKQRIQSILASVVNQKPARQAPLERAIALIHAIPGYQFSMALPRPKTRSGATSLRVEQKNREIFEPFVGYSMQQRGDKNMSVGLKANVNQAYLETIQLTGLIPIDGGDQQYYAAALTHALGYDGWTSRLNLSYYQDKDDTVLVMGGNEVNIANRIERQSANYGLAYPFVLNKNNRVTAELGLLYETEDREYGLSLNDTYLGALEDSLRYLIARLHVNAQRVTDDLAFAFGIGVNRSINGAFHYESDLGQQTIYDEGMMFYNLDVAASYTMAMRYVLSLRANGLYANDPIVPSQRVNFGGVNYGRAYSEGTLEGDRGYGAELKFMYKSRRKNVYFNPFVLVDYAYAEQVRLVLPYADTSSAAIGFETGYRQHLHLVFDYATPLLEHDERFSKAVYNLSLRWKF
ncbi:POTRA domain-containing protein [Vibrio furnissii]|uniref:POTRA domain-containing protein n=1 Tax=Vibrio furnissii TaxID=29494 RepID=UPI001EEB2DAC|nr:POTRA domain-containing protein [Vibrio furnissii]MCG6269660.1 hypothetical protein [Vibrio furnissii]